MPRIERKLLKGKSGLISHNDGQWWDLKISGCQDIKKKRKNGASKKKIFYSSDDRGDWDVVLDKERIWWEIVYDENYLGKNGLVTLKWKKKTFWRKIKIDIQVKSFIDKKMRKIVSK